MDKFIEEYGMSVAYVSLGIIIVLGLIAVLNGVSAI